MPPFEFQKSESDLVFRPFRQNLGWVPKQRPDRRPFNLQVAVGALGRIMKPHTRAWRAAGRLSEGRARHRPTGYYPPLS